MVQILVFVGLMHLANAAPCGPGAVADSGCVDCGADGTQACTACRPGSSLSITSSSDAILICKKCSAGHESDDQGAAAVEPRCVSCTGNKVRGANDDTQCVDCSANKKPNANRSACEFCDAGKQANNGVCEDCTGNKVRGANDDTQCVDCSANKKPNANRSACELCPAGEQLNNGKCEACPDNTARGANDDTQCVACPDGQTPNDAKTKCEKKQSASLSLPTSLFPVFGVLALHQ